MSSIDAGHADVERQSHTPQPGSAEAVWAAAVDMRKSEANLTVTRANDGYYQTIMKANPHLDPATGSSLARLTKADTRPSQLKSGDRNVLSVGDHLLIPNAPYPRPAAGPIPVEKAAGPGGRSDMLPSLPPQYATELERDLAEHRSATVYIGNEYDRVPAQAYVNAGLKEYPSGHVKIEVSSNPNIETGQIQKDGSIAISYAY
jgi:hypothetical protein